MKGFSNLVPCAANIVALFDKPVGLVIMNIVNPNIGLQGAADIHFFFCTTRDKAE